MEDDRKFVFPWKLLPNCRKFKIELGLWDKTFAKHNLDKRLAPEITIEPHTNKAINRYIMHQVKRLNESIDNPVKFWRIADHLMRYSNAFLVMQINKTKPQWHRTVRLKDLRAMIKEYKDIVRNDRTNVESVRVYIEKGPTKVRPLGVPTSG